MKPQKFRQFTEAENQTWKTLFQNLDHCRRQQAHPIFAEGVRKLGLDADRIPHIDEVNRRLASLTGWRGVPVEGLEDNASFFVGMAERAFPIGNFIRDARDVNYTPAPDIFHDLYGHLPFLADERFADFCYRFGKAAGKYVGNEHAMVQWGRLFWFGVEFPLIKTPRGNRIFGGGILSSFGESNYALSNEPEILPFDLKAIRDRDYKIDEFQKTMFILENEEQLYRSPEEFEKILR